MSSERGMGENCETRGIRTGKSGREMIIFKKEA